MMATMQAEGQRLIHESEHILRHDVQSAWEEQDFNLAVRRAQEVVELCLKGALRMLGLDYPRVHDVGPVFSGKRDASSGAVDERFWTGSKTFPLLAQPGAGALFLLRT